MIFEIGESETVPNAMGTRTDTERSQVQNDLKRD